MHSFLFKKACISAFTFPAVAGSISLYKILLYNQLTYLISQLHLILALYQKVMIHIIKI
eukprot:UN09951